MAEADPSGTSKPDELQKEASEKLHPKINNYVVVRKVFKSPKDKDKDAMKQLTIGNLSDGNCALNWIGRNLLKLNPTYKKVRDVDEINDGKVFGFAMEFPVGEVGSAGELRKWALTGYIAETEKICVDIELLKNGMGKVIATYYKPKVVDEAKKIAKVVEDADWKLHLASADPTLSKKS